MFTGITEGKGSVKSISKIKARSNKRRLHIELTICLGNLIKGLKVGSSVSIDGACLTIIHLHNRTATFELVEETTNRTCLGTLKVGDKVNIERSLRLGKRLEGHMVLGHVDTTGTVDAVHKSASQTKMWIKIKDKEVLSSIVSKGSIAVNGTSLTVVDLTTSAISVVLIPHTLAVTTLAEKSKGELVNIESDIIGKYVTRMLPKN
jgi:riboflavin synthase